MVSQSLTALVTLFSTLQVAVLATPTDLQLLYNPGPSYKCYNFTEISLTGPALPPYLDVSECSLLTNNGAGALNYNWYTTGTASSTDGQITSGGDGTPFTLTLLNDAQGVGQCSELEEVQVGYDFPGVAILKDAENNFDQYNLALYDQWIVSYDAFVHTPTLPSSEAQGCGGYNRKYLTTDFIYYWSSCVGSTCTQYKNLISIIHYNPILTMAALGPFSDPDGFRIQLNGGPSLIEGQTVTVELDFKAIMEKYSTDLCQGPSIPSTISLYALEIVSSNVNTSSVVDISNVSLILRNNPDSGTSYPLPDAPSVGAQSYCPPTGTNSNTPTCHVSYTITSTWATGYTIDLVLENTGTIDIDTWALSFTLPGSDTVSDYWSSVITQSGEQVTADNSGIPDTTISPGSGIDFGFNAASTDTSDVAIPAQFVLNGVVCTIN